jgi:hypothetical protein
VVGAHAAAPLRRADCSCRGLRMALRPALALLLVLRRRLLRRLSCLLCWPAAIRVCTMMHRFTDMLDTAG